VTDADSSAEATGIVVLVAEILAVYDADGVSLADEV